MLRAAAAAAAAASASAASAASAAASAAAAASISATAAAAAACSSGGNSERVDEALWQRLRSERQHVDRAAAAEPQGLSDEGQAGAGRATVRVASKVAAVANDRDSQVPERAGWRKAAAAGRQSEGRCPGRRRRSGGGGPVHRVLEGGGVLLRDAELCEGRGEIGDHPQQRKRQRLLVERRLQVSEAAAREERGEIAHGENIRDAGFFALG